MADQLEGSVPERLLENSNLKRRNINNKNFNKSYTAKSVDILDHSEGSDPHNLFDCNLLQSNTTTLVETNNKNKTRLVQNEQIGHLSPLRRISLQLKALKQIEKDQILSLQLKAIKAAYIELNWDKVDHSEGREPTN